MGPSLSRDALVPLCSGPKTDALEEPTLRPSTQPPKWLRVARRAVCLEFDIECSCRLCLRTFLTLPGTLGAPLLDMRRRCRLCLPSSHLAVCRSRTGRLEANRSRRTILRKPTRGCCVVAPGRCQVLGSFLSSWCVCAKPALVLPVETRWIRGVVHARGHARKVFRPRQCRGLRLAPLRKDALLVATLAIGEAARRQVSPLSAATLPGFRSRKSESESLKPSCGSIATCAVCLVWWSFCLLHRSCRSPKARGRHAASGLPKEAVRSRRRRKLVPQSCLVCPCCLTVRSGCRGLAAMPWP